MGSCGPCLQIALNLIGEPIYNPATVYNAGDYVVYAGILYVSTEDGNEGNNPQEGGAWEATTILEQLSYAIVQLFPIWVEDVAYSQNQIVRWNEQMFTPTGDSVWRLATSNIPGSETNTGNSPVLDFGWDNYGEGYSATSFPLSDLLSRILNFSNPSIYPFGTGAVSIPSGTTTACYENETAISANQNITLPSIDDYEDGQTITIVHPGLTASYSATILSVGATAFRGTVSAGAVGYPILSYDSTDLAPSSVTLMALTLDEARYWVVTASHKVRFEAP